MKTVQNSSIHVRFEQQGWREANASVGSSNLLPDYNSLRALVQLHLLEHTP